MIDRLGTQELTSRLVPVVDAVDRLAVGPRIHHVHRELGLVRFDGDDGAVELAVPRLVEVVHDVGQYYAGREGDLRMGWRRLREDDGWETDNSETEHARDGGMLESNRGRRPR